MSSLTDLSESVIEGRLNLVREQVKSLLDAGAAPFDIINNGLLEGMNVVGKRFKAGDMFVPEVLQCAKAMATGIEILKPLLVGGIQSRGKVVLGTVKGDLHDIGKNLVAMLMESGGLEVINLGVDVSPENFIEAVRKHNPDIVGMSALLTTTMPSMKATIDGLVKEGLRDKVKVVIGGAPVTKDYADTIGADGYAPDAASASDLCRELLG